MNENSDRFEALARNPQRPVYMLGEVVLTHDGKEGVVDAIYADLDSAIASGIVDDEWLANLKRKPTTPRSGVWYLLVHRSGATLQGEFDLKRKER